MISKNAYGSFVKSLTKPDILFPNLVAAIIIAVMNITTAISIAALVFSGPLVPYLSTGVGMFLVGTLVGGLLLAIFSGYHAVIGAPRSGQAPLVASLAAGIAVTLEGQSGDAIVATVIAGILATTLFVSVVLYLIGLAKLGGLVRYIPYPVMGGFFAGLGFLLFQGGVLVALGPIVSLDNLSSFLAMPVLIHLAPAMAFALILYMLEQRIKHWLLMPIYLAVSLAIFYLCLFVSDTNIEMAVAGFWLPDIGNGDAEFLPVFTLDQLSLVAWSGIFSQAGTIFIIVLMSVIMLLIDTSGIEITVNQDMDPNKELKAAGMANIVNGLGTGVLSIQAAADTAFVHKLGGRNFIMILVYALCIAAVIAIGPSPITYVPTFLLGGLLIYIGIDFLMSWVWHSRKKLPLKDFAVICIILLVVAFYGILEGVGVGILLALILFVHSYSQLSIIKSSMTGREHVSNIDRDIEQSHYLDEHGSQMHMFLLQGFLFFGTASRLLEDIRALLDDPERQEIRFLILDFKRVDSMDTSAANSFSKLLQVCMKRDIHLVLTDCSPEIKARFKTLFEAGDERSELAHIFSSLDEGVAWCGDTILEAFDTSHQEGDPVALLSHLMGNKRVGKIIHSYFEQVTSKKGKYLFQQGDPGDSLYLILKGAVSIVVDLANQEQLHLRTMRTGAIFGEMALYTASTRSASAIISEDSVLLRLDQKSYKQLQKNNPAEIGALHTFIVGLMSERLGRANREIIALSR